MSLKINKNMKIKKHKMKYYMGTFPGNYMQMKLPCK